MIPTRTSNTIVYGNTFTGKLELSPEQISAEKMLRDIEEEARMKGMEENMLTVLIHPRDPSKPDTEIKDVFDICHLWGNDGTDGVFHQTLRLLSFGECKCLLHYAVGTKGTECGKEHKANRHFVSLNDNTVEIAMQKGE